MTGNLSRAVLRGAGARESACLPDLTNFVYHIQHKKRKNSCRWTGVFSVTYQGIKSDTQRVLSSLLE